MYDNKYLCSIAQEFIDQHDEQKWIFRWFQQEQLKYQPKATSVITKNPPCVAKKRTLLKISSDHNK